MKKLSLPLKSVSNVDETSAEILNKTAKGLGFIPNMYAGMANNTALLDGYVHAYKSFRANAGFTPPEQEVIFLSAAVENECDYCVAAHSFVGDNMTKVPKDVTDAIRNDAPIADEKLRALSIFTKAMVGKRGNPTQEDVQNFLSAGYSEEQVLGVIAGIGVKTFSNYFNHVFETPLDEVFEGRSWVKETV